MVGSVDLFEAIYDGERGKRLRGVYPPWWGKFESRSQDAVATY